MGTLPRPARWCLIALWSVATLLIGETLLTNPPALVLMPRLLIGLALFILSLAVLRVFKVLAARQDENRRSHAVAQEAHYLTWKLEELQAAATAIAAAREPVPLVEAACTRLAALLEASASWAILLDGAQARIVGERGLPQGFEWNAAAYAGELDQPGVRQLDAPGIARLHATPMRWRTLVIIPLVCEEHTLGGLCLAFDRAITLAGADCRILLAFARQAALALEQTRLLEELRHKQDELIRSSKLAALGTFSAGIAHEFNNLLAGILGYAQLGLMSEDVAEKDEALEVAVRACLRGRNITGDLLTFARRRDPQRSLHQLRDVIEASLAFVEHELEMVNIRIERRFQPVPSIICDPDQISQVVLHLLTNARDAMAELGGGMITIELARQEELVELLISDTGSGIAPPILDQMFQPFMTTKGALGGSATPGIGLGLAICYGIIESHGGTITIASTVQHGTTVTVRLPIYAQVPEAVAPVAGSLRGLQILVVGDDQMVVRPLVRLLENHAHQVVVARDSELALRCYRAQPFDLVISDVMMPGMGVIEFLRQVRELDSQAQVLVMTGQIVAHLSEQIKRAGALAVISKPFVADELLAIIAQSGRVRSVAAPSSGPPAVV